MNLHYHRHSGPKTFAGAMAEMDRLLRRTHRKPTTYSRLYRAFKFLAYKNGDRISLRYMKLNPLRNMWGKKYVRKRFHEILYYADVWESTPLKRAQSFQRKAQQDSD